MAAQSALLAATSWSFLKVSVICMGNVYFFSFLHTVPLSSGTWRWIFYREYAELFEQVFQFPNHSPSPQQKIYWLLFIYFDLVIFLLGWSDVPSEEGLERPLHESVLQAFECLCFLWFNLLTAINTLDKAPLVRGEQGPTLHGDR